MPRSVDGPAAAPARAATRRFLHTARRLGNTLNLSTPLGLAIARVGRAHVHRGPHGLLLAEGYRPRFPFATAFTVGNVVIGREPFAIQLHRHPRLLDHEEVHSWQYLYSFGLPFLPLYTAAMAWSWLRTGDRAAANVFERQAGLLAGGYAEVPPRPLTTRWRDVRALRRRG